MAPHGCQGNTWINYVNLSTARSIERAKEVGVRKVLGADEKNIIFLLSKEFILLVLSGNLIALPAAYLIMNNWLDNFSSRIQFGLSVFLITGSLVLLIAMITVSYKTLKVAHSNPIGALRHE